LFDFNATLVFSSPSEQQRNHHGQPEHVSQISFHADTLNGLLANEWQRYQLSVRKRPPPSIPLAAATERVRMRAQVKERVAGRCRLNVVWVSRTIPDDFESCDQSREIRHHRPHLIVNATGLILSERRHA
jgi:hypothetical protein